MSIYRLTHALLCLLAGSFAYCKEPAQLQPQERAEGWQLLFDGSNAHEHWRGYNKDHLPDGWVVEDGALVCKGGGGDIITIERFDSFELSLEWKISEGGNSGIFFKVVESDEPIFFSGPEVQILHNGVHSDPQLAGWMYGLYGAEVDATKPAGEWNHLVLKCQRTAAGTYLCEHWLNGVKYVSYEIGSDDWKQRVAQSKFHNWPAFGVAQEGHIGLQDHGDYVAFRHIKIRRLENAPLSTSGRHLND